MTFEEMELAARGINLAPEIRDGNLFKLTGNFAFPALLAKVLELEEDLAEELAKYERTGEEKAMDSGGLHALRKLRGDLKAIYDKPEEEKEVKETGV